MRGTAVPGPGTGQMEPFPQQQKPGRMSSNQVPNDKIPDLPRNAGDESKSVNAKWLNDNSNAIEKLLKPNENEIVVDVTVDSKPASGGMGDVFKVTVDKIDLSTGESAPPTIIAVKLANSRGTVPFLEGDMQAYDALAGEKLPPGVRVPEPIGKITGKNGTPVALAMKFIDTSKYQTLTEWLRTNPSDAAKAEMRRKILPVLQMMDAKGFGRIESGPQNFLVNPATGELMIIDMGSWQKKNNPKVKVSDKTPTEIADDLMRGIPEPATPAVNAK